jgi:hypothetical protein
LLDTSGGINGTSPPVATTGETITYTGSPNRTIQITGIHVAASILSYIVWDYVATATTSPINVDGGGNAASGAVAMQNLLTNVTSTSTITTPLNFTAGCCMATGGTITTSFSAGTTETLTMTGTCGAATLNGNPITLNHCW